MPKSDADDDPRRVDLRANVGTLVAAVDQILRQVQDIFLKAAEWEGFTAADAADAARQIEAIRVGTRAVLEQLAASIDPTGPDRLM